MFGYLNKQKISVDKDKIHDILVRGTEDVFVKESLEKKLFSGKQLRVKLGFDPTGSRIHIGRASILWKLRAFQELGHHIVFIVGDFTAQIGDPSDKLDKRPMLTGEQIKNNLVDYKKQVGRIIDLSQAEFKFNSDWLKKLGLQEISELAECFSVQQMSARRNFKERLESGTEVSLREFLYPLLQGYDSVMVKADVEIGGFDQLFNLKAGRTIQKHYGQPEQDVLTIKMLLGTDGRKMSTSWGNVINITDDKNDMFGKIMSIDDKLIAEYFILGTKVSLQEINKITENISHGANPRDIKLQLAREIVSIYHGKEGAKIAEENFIKTFTKKEIPSDIKVVLIPTSSILGEVALKENVVQSKTEFRRLVVEGAISNMDTGEKIADPNYKIEKTGTYKIGKRRFIKIIVK